MVSPSRCPPWQPERPGPTRREPRRAQRSYTTPRDTILSGGTEMHDIAIRQEIVDRVIAKRSRLHLSKVSIPRRPRSSWSTCRTRSARRAHRSRCRPRAASYRRSTGLQPRSARRMAPSSGWWAWSGTAPAWTTGELPPGRARRPGEGYVGSPPHAYLVHVPEGKNDPRASTGCTLDELPGDKEAVPWGEYRKPPGWAAFSD